MIDGQFVTIYHTVESMDAEALNSYIDGVIQPFLHDYTGHYLKVERISFGKETKLRNGEAVEVRSIKYMVDTLEGPKLNDPPPQPEDWSDFEIEPEPLLSE